jgi:hypothetical protein
MNTLLRNPADGPMTKILRSLSHNRMVLAAAAVLLAIVAVPAIFALVLKALGLLHGPSLHTWLLDVGQNVGSSGARGAAGAGAAAAAGGKGSGKGGKGSGSGGSGKGSKDPVGPDYVGSGGKDPSPGNYTPTKGSNPLDDPALHQAQQQFLQNNPQLVPNPTPTPSNPVNTVVQALIQGMRGYASGGSK